MRNLRQVKREHKAADGITAAGTARRRTGLTQSESAENYGEMMKVQIYTDGSARGNPDGPGGYGTVLQYTDSEGTLHEKEISGGYRRTTNNRMELMAVIAALEALNCPCEVDLYSDSSYVVNAFNQGWIDKWIADGWMRGRKEPVKNQDLWKRLLADMKPHQVTFHWLKGHAGQVMNERCDRLATSAADGDCLAEDTVQ